MANIPHYLPDPFARAAWHMRETADPARQAFWNTLADFIAGAGKSLALTGGNWAALDEPASVRTAETVATFYLDHLSAEELAKIPPDVHS